MEMFSDVWCKQRHNDKKMGHKSSIEEQIIPTPDTPALWLSKRLVVVMVLFSCLVVSQIIRNHINITVVEMTSNKSIVEGNITIEQSSEFNWDPTTVALIISVFPYGGLFSFFGGYFVNKFGGSVTCSMSMTISGIATLLHPAALGIDFRLFLLCRFITGLCQTFFYVSVVEMYSRWFPKKERSKLVSFSFNGSNVGVALTYPISGYLAQRWGWQMVFYVLGCLPLIIAAICITTVKNRPCQDRRISQTELLYILQGTDTYGKSKVNNPYRKIFKSAPLWSLCSATFTYMWIATSLGVTLPLYVEDLTQKNIADVGWISSIPSTVYTVLFPFAGIIMDHFHNSGIVTLTRMHKTMIGIAFFSANILFISSTFVTNLSVTLGFFVLIDVLTSSVPLIMEINTVGLSPEHAGIVGSLVTFFLSLGAIVASTATGFMISNHSRQDWNHCFYLTSGIAILGAAIYLIFGSSETQNWSTPTINTKDDSKGSGKCEIE